MANLSGKLPKGEGNGLVGISRDLIDRPEEVHVAIVLLDCAKITTDVDNGDVTPTARIRRIEAVRDPEDKARLRVLLRREFERRTGKTVLPYDLEEDLRAAFDDNPDTPSE